MKFKERNQATFTKNERTVNTYCTVQGLSAILYSPDESDGLVWTFLRTWNMVSRTLLCNVNFAERKAAAEQSLL